MLRMARFDHKSLIALSTLLFITQPLCLAFKCSGQCVEPSECVSKTTGDCPSTQVCCHSTTVISEAKFKPKFCTKSSACANIGGECVKYAECKVSKDKIKDKNWSGKEEGKPKILGRVWRGIKDNIKTWWGGWTSLKGLCGGHDCVCCLTKEKKYVCPTSKSCWQDNNYRGSCVMAGQCVPPNSLAPTNSCSQTGGSCQCCLRPMECNGREAVKCKKMDGRCTDFCKSNEVEISGGCLTNMCRCCAPSACNPRKKCTKRGGFCVTEEKDCTGTILKKGCHGTGCLCCLN